MMHEACLNCNLLNSVQHLITLIQCIGAIFLDDAMIGAAMVWSWRCNVSRWRSCMVPAWAVRGAIRGAMCGGVHLCMHISVLPRRHSVRL